jgi:glycosyltransferase involved in cell wall biosynthesis
MDTVRRLRQELALESVVELVGWVPVERLPDYLAQAHAGIVGNRRVTELRRNWMLPVKMLECAAMEIPTIAPRLRIINHYFDEQSAILYEPDNIDDMARCIQAVYRDRTRLESLKAGLRAFNASLNWAQMERRYLALLSEGTS